MLALNMIKISSQFRLTTDNLRGVLNPTRSLSGTKTHRTSLAGLYTACNLQYIISRSPGTYPLNWMRLRKHIKTACKSLNKILLRVTYYREILASRIKLISIAITMYYFIVIHCNVIPTDTKHCYSILWTNAPGFHYCSQCYIYNTVKHHL